MYNNYSILSLWFWDCGSKMSYILIINNTDSVSQRFSASSQEIVHMDGNSLNGHIAAAAKSLQLCPTLCDPKDGNPPGSPVPGILQTRTLEWVANAFSNARKWKVKVKLLSRVRLLATPWTAAYEAPPPMGFSRQEDWSGVPWAH